MIKQLKIAVVDDHPIFLKGLVEVIQEELPNSIIESYKSSKEALIKIVENKPDICILDLDMPEMNGVVLSTALKLKLPEIKIIILTMHKEYDIIRSVIAKGVQGYVFKDDAVNDLVEAIEIVMNGNQYISKSTQFTLENFKQDVTNVLTKTECLVLKYVAENMTSKEIANVLSVSVKTVENHRNNISKKLELTGSNSLVKFALAGKYNLIKEDFNQLEMENYLIKDQNELIQIKLKMNQQELISSSIYINQKNELFSNLKKEIDAISKKATVIDKGSINKLKSIIQNNSIFDSNFQSFKIHFEQVHPDFFSDLLEKYPNLSQNELRLSAYLHLNLSNKEIATLLNINPDSVKKAKMRLKTKLNN